MFWWCSPRKHDSFGRLPTCTTKDRRFGTLCSYMQTWLRPLSSAAGIEDIDVDVLVGTIFGSTVAAIPGMHLLASSVLSGSANAFLTLRIGMITKTQEWFKHDREVQVFIATARGASGRPHQLRHSQLQNRLPHQVWPASLLRVRSLERLPSVATREQSQDLSKHRSRGNTSCQDPIVQPVDPRPPPFETTSLLP